MTLFSPLSTPMFRNLKLRGRKPGCPGCDPAASSTGNLQEYEDDIEMCGVPEEESDNRVSAEELREALQSGRDLQIVDVRPEVEYGICSIPGSISMASDSAFLTMLISYDRHRSQPSFTGSVSSIQTAWCGGGGQGNLYRLQKGQRFTPRCSRPRERTGQLQHFRKGPTRRSKCVEQH